jgi:hypothetical protein
MTSSDGCESLRTLLHDAKPEVFDELVSAEVLVLRAS